MNIISTKGHILKATKLGMCLVLLVGASVGTRAAAEEMDGASLKQLAQRGTWIAQTSGYGYWTWNKDSTVCLRLFGEEEDCADTGTWAVDGDKLCYEFEWWGEAYGMRAMCFSVIALDDEIYEVQHEGSGVTSTVFKFGLSSPHTE